MIKLSSQIYKKRKKKTLYIYQKKKYNILKKKKLNFKKIFKI